MPVHALQKKETNQPAVAKAVSQPRQRKAIEQEEDAMQMQKNPLQKKNALEDEEPHQLKQTSPFDSNGLQKPLQRKPPALQFQLSSGKPFRLQHEADDLARQENNTGLPDNLKAGVESMSGYSMDDVKVHYNSDQPAQVQALAYAQGTDIHVAPGQEKHLPHEAWHVVQQKQGRVQPTLQMKEGVPVNDDQYLEEEADKMGSSAVQRFSANPLTGPISQAKKTPSSQTLQRKPGTIQRNKDTLALGFTDLKNVTYGQDDAFGKRPENDGQLAKFREVTKAMGPEAMGINQQANADGSIQPQFTAGIKAAMASAREIKQNLAGFTPAQINFAFNHRPELNAAEITLLRNHHPDFGQIMMGGRIVNKVITGRDGAEWFAMKDLLVNKDDPASGRHPQAWAPWQAPISVWELSHHLHNTNLFNKTEFFYFDTNFAHYKISQTDLTAAGITLNLADLMTDEELDVVPPSAFTVFVDIVKSWFKINNPPL